MKRFTTKEQLKEKEIVIDEISHMTHENQAEVLADSFAKISQEYDSLKKEDIHIPYFTSESIPIISAQTVEKLLGEIITNKATIKDDIPAIILKTFARNVSIPTTILVNRCIKEGAWPNIFKSEIVTPVPKVYPTKRIEDLRNITGLFTLNKVMEKSIAELMVNDMKEKLDPSQYANR